MYYWVFFILQQQPKSPNPVARTPPGPARYSIRGPPVNGRIGEYLQTQF